MQGAAYKGMKLDGAAAADHTAALYCTINETLERLAAKKMYKAGATALRDSVDRALLMCSHLESGTGCGLQICMFCLVSHRLMQRQQENRFYRPVSRIGLIKKVLRRDTSS
jgi:hypothetical protein